MTELHVGSQAESTTEVPEAKQALEEMGSTDNGICTEITVGRVSEVSKVAALAISDIEQGPGVKSQHSTDQILEDKIAELVTAAVQAVLADPLVRKDIYEIERSHLSDQLAVERRTGHYRHPYIQARDMPLVRNLGIRNIGETIRQEPSNDTNRTRRQPFSTMHVAGKRSKNLQNFAGESRIK